MKKRLVTLGKTGITGLLLFLIFRNVDFDQFWGILRNARFELLATAFVVLWIGHSICIFRWRILMRPLMPVPTFLELFRIYCIGLFFNLAFPTAVGGDVVKVYYAGKTSRLYAESFAATFLDRDAGMVAMMLIACWASLVMPLHSPGLHLTTVVWASTGAFLLANIGIFTPSLHRLVNRGLRKLSMMRTAGRIDTLSGAFQKMGRERGILAGSLGISLLNQLLVIVVSWMLACGLRMDIPIGYFLVFIPVVTLVSMIPVSLNGMGLREYAFISLLGAIGAGREASIALGLLSSGAILLSGVPGGILYLLFRDPADSREMAAINAGLT